LSDESRPATERGTPKPVASSNQFIVHVADNFHPYDEDEVHTKEGSYTSYARAVLVAKQIVCESLLHLAGPGMSGAELYQAYAAGGEDPFIVGRPEGAPFSAWAYAKHLCGQIAVQCTKL